MLLYDETQTLELKNRQAAMALAASYFTGSQVNQVHQVNHKLRTQRTFGVSLRIVCRSIANFDKIYEKFEKNKFWKKTSKNFITLEMANNEKISLVWGVFTIILGF